MLKSFSRPASRLQQRSPKISAIFLRHPIDEGIYAAARHVLHVRGPTESIDYRAI